MAVNLKDPEVDRLVRDLAAATGESITTAVAVAVRERLERLRSVPKGRDLEGELLAIADRCARLPVIDERPEDDILGYKGTDFAHTDAVPAVV